jgi:hypothetical protein
VDQGAEADAGRPQGGAAGGAVQSICVVFLSLQIFCIPP